MPILLLLILFMYLLIYLGTGPHVDQASPKLIVGENDPFLPLPPTNYGNLINTC